VSVNRPAHTKETRQAGNDETVWYQGFQAIRLRNEIHSVEYTVYVKGAFLFFRFHRAEVRFAIDKRRKPAWALAEINSVIFFA